MRVTLARCAVLSILALTGCASLSGAGETYSQTGRHHLAVHYLISAHMDAPDDPEAQARLIQELGRARALWNARKETLEERGEPTLALIEAKRIEELAQRATSMGLVGFEPEVPSQEVARISRAVGKRALRDVDDATSAGTPPGEMLTTLRTALALRPHDGEIQGRYEGLRRRLVRHMSIRLACPADTEDLCTQLSERLTRAVTAARRELVNLVGPEAPERDTEMVIRLTVQSSDTGWKDKSRGVAKGVVKRLNQYKEPALNKKGKPIKDAVKATYVVRNRSTWARSDLTVTIRDLRANGATLWSGARKSEKS
ncbi:MAG: hypothetical protein VX938_03080, partial [Myxococcota bacterium]|nr:hypothetical protein [Myxococcota bacterium]